MFNPANLPDAHGYNQAVVKNALQVKNTYRQTDIRTNICIYRVASLLKMGSREVDEVAGFFVFSHMHTDEGLF